jgi:hypothetical protein
MIPRPSNAGGSVTKRMDVDAQAIDVQVLAYDTNDGTGQQIASKTFPNLPLGTHLTVTNLD